MNLRTLRRITQGIFLLLFLYLFLATAYPSEERLETPVELFFWMDPLLQLLSFIASRSVPEKFFIAGSVLAATILFGRFFCGWICPLGTLHNILSRWKGQSEKRGAGWKNFQRTKYCLLIFLLVSSLFSLQFAGLFDPISLLYRTLSTSLYPAFVLSAASTYEATRFFLPEAAVGVSDRLVDFVVGEGAQGLYRAYHQSLFLFVVFLVIALLNRFRKRFWCRYLCPLGALLGLAASKALLEVKIGGKCTSCGRCNDVCPAEAEPFPTKGWRRRECYFCFNCVSECPVDCVEVGWSRETSSGKALVDLSKREWILSSLAGLAAVPLFGISPARSRAHPARIRPPGALGEREFLARCVRCGACMKVCPTGGIQPALLEAGLEGLWSPVLDMRLGYCEFNCNLCGQICPTGALEDLPLAVKQKLKIGLAFIDEGRCLPYAFGKECIVCEEHCPTPTKAIWFEERMETGRDGFPVKVKRPRVDPDLCNGCGICENKCPVVDLPAIRVSGVNEDRATKNKFLLDRGTEIY